MKEAANKPDSQEDRCGWLKKNEQRIPQMALEARKFKAQISLFQPISSAMLMHSGDPADMVEYRCRICTHAFQSQ